MPESLYGAPYLCMHRAELHDALAIRAAGTTSSISARSSSASSRAAGRVTLSLRRRHDSATADAVIGADGVHSVVRDIIVGPDAPIHRGRIAYRAVFPASLMNGKDIGRSRTKWWGTDRHIVIYYTTKARSEVYFVTSVPEPADWVTREVVVGQGRREGIARGV